MSNRTFAIIKPDSVKNNYTDKIYNHIISAKFKIISFKLIRLSLKQAEAFYQIHQDKPFYNELTKFMSSGKCMVLALEKDNAVEEWRKTIGDTNPSKADKNTIRNLYGTNIGNNAVHGSDSNENAKKEIAFFFSDYELI